MRLRRPHDPERVGGPLEIRRADQLHDPDVTGPRPWDAGLFQEHRMPKQPRYRDAG